MKTLQKTRVRRGKHEDLPGYPEYSRDEDIYRKGKEEDEIDPENIDSKKVIAYEDDLELNDEAGSNLDIPGSEMDDDLEDVGSEDEENNYYSLSDDHADDLEDLI
jgi:hypothetical protein